MMGSTSVEAVPATEARAVRPAALRTSPRIVEIVGPAGAGKTTLMTALDNHTDSVKVGADLRLRHPGHAMMIAAYAPLVLPILLRPGSPGRRFTWEEIKALLYLRIWPGVVAREAARNGGWLLLDHGPVFKLAMLRSFGPERLSSESYAPWWNATVHQWAQTLDLILWLDAPDATLVERINARGQGHAVKGRPQTEAADFLSRYRSAYEQVLSALTAAGGPLIRRFDTAQAPLGQIVIELLETFDARPRGNHG